MTGPGGGYLECRWYYDCSVGSVVGVRSRMGAHDGND